MRLFVVLVVVCATGVSAKDAKELKEPLKKTKDIANQRPEVINDAFREGRGLKDSLSSISSALKSLNQVNSIVSGVNMSEIGDASTRVAKELSKSLKVDVFAVGKALAGAGAAVGATVFLGGMAALLATGLGFFNYSPKLYDAGYPFKTYQNRVGPSSDIFGPTQQAVYNRVQQGQQAFGQHPAQSAYLAGAPLVQQQQRQGSGQRPVAKQEQRATTAQYPVYHGSKQHEGRAAELGEVSARTARVLDEVKQAANPELVPAIQDLLEKLGEAVNTLGPQVMAAARR